MADRARVARLRAACEASRAACSFARLDSVFELARRQLLGFGVDRDALSWRRCGDPFALAAEIVDEGVEVGGQGLAQEVMADVLAGSV